MNKKIIRLTESKLKNIISESVRSVLREERDIDDDNYFGGGLPDSYFNDDAPNICRLTKSQIAKLDSIADTIVDIANDTDDDRELLLQAVDCIEKFLSTYK